MGMFFGYNANNKAVKVFGMENLWGNVWKIENGIVALKGKVYVKLTPNTADGSTATAYNKTGVGYLDTGINFANFSAGSGSYISSMKEFKGVLLPSNNTGSTTTGGCDCCWFNNGLDVGFGRFGADSVNGFACGAFALHLTAAVGRSWWLSGCSLSFKP